MVDTEGGGVGIEIAFYRKKALPVSPYLVEIQLF